jgi:hypothetical protein
MTSHIYFSLLFLVIHSIGLILGLILTIRVVKSLSIFGFGMKLVIREFFFALVILISVSVIANTNFAIFYTYLLSLILSTLGVTLFILAGPGLAERSLTMFLIVVVFSSQGEYDLKTLKRISQNAWWESSDQTETRVNEQLEAKIFQMNESGFFQLTQKGRMAAIGISLISKIFNVRHPSNL